MNEQKQIIIIAGPNGAGKTTLSGKGYLKHIKRWQKAGYKVQLIFLSINDVNISIKRVAKRVSQGGHNIPIPVIKRRFKAGLELFHNHYKKCVDEWALYDNSDKQIILLKEGRKNE